MCCSDSCKLLPVSAPQVIQHYLGNCPCFDVQRANIEMEKQNLIENSGRGLTARKKFNLLLTYIRTALGQKGHIPAAEDTSKEWTVSISGDFDPLNNDDLSTHNPPPSSNKPSNKSQATSSDPPVSSNQTNNQSQTSSTNTTQSNPPTTTHATLNHYHCYTYGQHPQTTVLNSNERNTAHIRWEP